MNQDERLINGELLRLRREAQGWVVTDMASRACLSVKQVRQLEEGGTSAFYSTSVKLTAAKKVGGLLGLAPEEVFISSAPTEDAAASTVTEVAHDVAEPVQTAKPVVAPEPAMAVEVVAPSAAASASPEPTTSSEETKPKTSLWLIVGLFAAALGVAAYLQPKDEVPVEPAPPLQVVPTEAAASATEAAASAASAASEPVAPAAVVTVQKAASGPVATASTPASAAAVAAPAASAASKAP